MATIWFTGVCDTLLARIEAWETNYQKGQVYATRHYLNERFEHEDIPVQYVHTVPFSLLEITHLVRILSEEWPLKGKGVDMDHARTTADFIRLYGIIRNPLLRKKHEKIIATAANGMFFIVLLLEWSELISLRDLLRRVKNPQAVIGSGVAGMAAAQKAAGKGMWEN